MITSPPRFHTPVVLWSKLRVLTLSPHEKEEMACLQPILNAASNALEELYLTNLRVGECRCSVFYINGSEFDMFLTKVNNSHLLDF